MAKKSDPPNMMEDLKDLTKSVRELVESNHDLTEAIHGLIQSTIINGGKPTPVEQRVGLDPLKRGSGDQGEI
jgi:hypothetical protein